MPPRSSKVFAFSAALLGAFLFNTCTGASEAACPHRYLPDDTIQGNAGCLVVDNHRLLLIKGLNGKVSIPGGGKNTNESAACTAYRETLEETALSVRPTHIVRQWENGFIMFNCELISPASQAAVVRPLEISRVLWVEASQFDRYQWRFPHQKQWLYHWLTQSTPGSD